MNKRPITILAVLCAAALAVMIAALLYTGRAPQFTPPPFDAAAQAGTPAVPEGIGYGELDASAFRFSAAGVLTVRDGGAELWLTNPAGSPVWLKARILDGSGAVLGETGLLRPGEYVRAAALNTVPAQTAPVTVKIMAYEPETYYSAGSVLLQTQLRAA